MSNLTIDLTEVYPIDNLSDEFNIEILSKSKWHDYSDCFPFDGSVSQCCPSVPKDSLYVLTWQGSREQIKRFPHYRIIIPEGDDMHPVATGVKCLKAQNEFEFTKAFLGKNYCTITFNIPDCKSTNSFATILSNTCGLDLITGKPIPGEMYCEKPIIDGIVTFTVPRLSNNTLSLRISSGNTMSGEYDISEILALKRYDWNSYNLEDCRIILSVTK